MLWYHSPVAREKCLHCTFPQAVDMFTHTHIHTNRHMIVDVCISHFSSSWLAWYYAEYIDCINCMFLQMILFHFQKAYLGSLQEPLEGASTLHSLRIVAVSNTVKVLVYTFPIFACVSELVSFLWSCPFTLRLSALRTSPAPITISISKLYPENVSASSQ